MENCFIFLESQTLASSAIDRDATRSAAGCCCWLAGPITFVLGWIVPVSDSPDLRARRGGARIVTFEANEVDHDVSLRRPRGRRVRASRRDPRGERRPGSGPVRG